MSRHKRIYIVVLCWTLFLVIDSLKKNGLFSSGPFFWYQYFPGMVFWILITIPSFKLFRKTAEFTTIKRISSVLALGVGIGIVKNITAWLVYFLHGVSLGDYSLSLESFIPFISRLQTFYYMESIIIAFVMIIIFYILELNKKYRDKSVEATELEVQLAKANLNSLKMQLQPHFLFNAHNTVSMLIRTKQYDQATAMISKISDLLRNSLNSNEGQFGTVEDEIAIIQAYLDIEQVRFEDHLDITFNLDASASSFSIPHLLLQPIVENAFKHGISKNIGKSRLEINTRLKSSELLLSIYNTGPSISDKPKYGVGLSNTLERLDRLYGRDNYSLDHFNLNGGVTVEIRIPNENGEIYSTHR